MKCGERSYYLVDMIDKIYSEMDSDWRGPFEVVGAWFYEIIWNACDSQ